MVSKANALIFQGINMLLNEKVVASRLAQWEENFNTNLPVIKRHKSFVQLPYWTRQPVVVIGAGPGLDKNVQLLKDFDIPTICVSRALTKVLKYTKPTLVTSIEADPAEAQFLKDLDTSDLKLVVSADADPAIVNAWDGEIYFTLQYIPEAEGNGLCTRQRMATGIPPMGYGGNVGTYSYILAQALQANPIVLMGMDMSFERVNNPPPEAGIILDGDDGMTTELDTVEGKRYVNSVFVNYAYVFLTLSKSYASQGIVTINCTEGGILYEPHIHVMTFADFRKSVEAFDNLNKSSKGE